MRIAIVHTDRQSVETEANAKLEELEQAGQEVVHVALTEESSGLTLLISYIPHEAAAERFSSLVGHIRTEMENQALE